MRGIYAENIQDHTPTDNGNSYFSVRVGSLWALVLDCGEDKPDTNAEYGHTICCANFRARQTKYIENIIKNADSEYNAEGVICTTEAGVPFLPSIPLDPLNRDH